MASPRPITQILAESRARLNRLGPTAAHEEHAQGAILVDTRCGELLSRDGRIPGAIHIPLSVLYWRADPTSGHADPRIARPDHRLILICEHGYSSSLAAATLQAMGFDRVTDVVGGFDAWRSGGLPIEAPTETS